MNMSQNWMRHFELQLIDSDDTIIDLGGFKATFKINWFDISTATRTGIFKIYNLSSNTINKISAGEFTKIRLIVGYDGLAPVVDASQVGVARKVNPADVGQLDGRNYGQLFDGEIRYTLTGKDSPVDSYLLIQAADSDRAFVTTMTHQTLAAGWTAETMFNALMKDFEANGVTRGRTPRFPSTVYSRGRVLHGMTRDLMDNVAVMCQATWMFVDNQVHMLGKDEVMHETVMLNSATGLIGMPQQTIDQGINVRCLINPNIRVNGLIQLNEKSIYQTELSNNAEAAQAQKANKSGEIIKPGRLDADGIYIIKGIMYSGDTKGQAWYMDMSCQSYQAWKQQSQEKNKQT